MSPRRITFGRRKLWALPIALALLAAQTSAALHFALVRHARCAAHGEAVHVDAHREAEPPRASSEEPAVSTFGELDVTSHGHDHCLAAAVRSTSEVWRNPAFALLVAREEPPPAVAQGGIAGTIALLRLAPKGSPPA